MKLSVCLWALEVAVTLLHAQTSATGPAGVLQQYALAQFVGSGTDTIHSITSDATGNIYLAGTTSSPDLPVLNAAQPAIAGSSDAFVAKMDSGGDLIWSTFLGGTAADTAASIALDAAGNVFVTGNTASPDFP